MTLAPLTFETAPVPQITIAQLVSLVQSAAHDLNEAIYNYPEHKLHLQMAHDALVRGLKKESEAPSWLAKVGTLRAAIKAASSILQDVIERWPDLRTTATGVCDVAEQFALVYSWKVLEH